MTISIKQKYTCWPEPVCVVVDGFCNHAATDDETEEFASPGASNEYKSHQDRIEVCRRCRAWRFVTLDTDDAYQEFEWNGVTVMPQAWEGLTK